MGNVSMRFKVDVEAGPGVDGISRWERVYIAP